MSKAYQIRVQETVRRHVVVSDGVETRLDLLDLLPAPEQNAMLGAELEKKGFRVEGDRAVRTEEDGVEIVVDLSTRKVWVGKHTERDVERVVDRIVLSATEKLTEKTRAAVVEAATSDIEITRRKEQRDLTASIERRLGDLRAELDAIVVAVTQQALKKKAAQIGEIESIEQDEETGSMTIRVRV